MNTNSRLVIVMAHYNNPKGLEDSLASINEPFDIDILVIDDGSVQKPNENRVREIYISGRVFFEYLEKNSGVGVAANLGLKRALEMNYELIGRLDCGDIFKENKCAKQIDYLDAHSDVKLLGTCADVLDNNGVFLHELQLPSEYEIIKKRMFINSMFLNPSVIFRSEILEVVGDYPLKYKRASQDYAFFFKVVNNYKAENLTERLMYYIVDPNSISTTKRRLQVLNRLRVILDNFYFGIYPIYGLFRNILLLFLSRTFTTQLKKKTKKS
ncbi:glycosyltransferase [Winogradskyella sp.]|uniref:glycosyltransferase n=1 Tax=Winogradskyella sp. TaxID=1883156 RepID=UPI00262AD172|nr:glycosyltransferase [Winogradskyella sp.]